MPTIRGTILHVLFENQGFVILRIRAHGRPSTDGESWGWEESDHLTEFCIKGNITHPCMGVEYRFTGKIEESGGYGPQMMFSEYSRERPLTQKAVVDYLSFNCSGVGVRIAEAIYKAFGSDSVEVLKTDPLRVVQHVSQLSVAKATAASAKLSDIEDDEQLKLQVATLLSGTTANKGHINSLIRKFGSAAPDIIQHEPYRLVEINGIGFKTADSIAVKNGVDLESPERVGACADYIIKSWERSGGHTCILREILISKISEETNLHSEIIIRHIDDHIKIGTFVGASSFVFRKSMYAKERSIANMLAKLCQAVVRPVPPIIDGLEEDQIEAVRAASLCPVTLMTGKPGSGKTHTITKICETFNGFNIALCAQTGKAARRITEITGHNATTIHSLLVPKSVVGDDDDVSFSFTHGKSNPLKCDVVIVDEASLLDVDLAHSLISSIRLGCRLIIVGDPNQLPSVGPGKILTDLINSKSISHVELTKIKRQSAGSMIIKACHEINNNKTPDINNEEGSDLFIWPTSFDEKTISSTIDLFMNRIQSKFGFCIEDIQIVTPNKNPDLPISTYRINSEIQKMINNQFDITASEKIYDKKMKISFRVGDRVINSKNTKYYHFNPEDSSHQMTDEVLIVNGDIGKIIGVCWKGAFYGQKHLESISAASLSEVMNGRSKDLFIIVEFCDGCAAIPSKKNFLDLAYAVTCHKFQGSECPVVIIPIPRGNNNLMCRSWIYTALSRGKKLVVVVGPKEAFGFACMTPDRKRDTFLAYFIKDEMSNMITPNDVELGPSSMMSEAGEELAF